MRLTDKQQTILKNTFRQFFGENDHLWLFGSRVDDAKRGGDIDLYVQTREENTPKLVKQRQLFLIELQRQLGEQKIDVVLHQLQHNVDLPIYKVAQQTGILLV